MPNILTRRALLPGRLARLGATPDLHHGLLADSLKRHVAPCPFDCSQKRFELEERRGFGIDNHWNRLYRNASRRGRRFDRRRVRL
jgi:hypothetical protein